MPHAAITTRTSARGFSIVEIMVALSISAILLAGVLTVVYSSKVTYLENERVGRLQENGRAAMEILLRDLRGAGFPGCAQPLSGLFDINNTVNNSNTLLYKLTEPVYGFQGTATGWSPALDSVITAAISPNTVAAGTDVLVLRTVRSGSPVFRVPLQTSPTQALITVQKDPSETIKVRTPLVIGDCGGASIFIATSFSSSTDGTTATIAHATGGTEPSNVTDDFGFLFTPNARIAPIVTMIYFIQGSSLWRIVGNNPPEEVIQGVETLQVRYGIDTDADALVDRYVDADGVANWANVISVSIAMVVRSNDPNSPTPDTRTYRLFDATPAGLPAVTFVAPGDRYQRSVFTTTVTLRNRTT